MATYRWQSNFQVYSTAGAHHEETPIGFCEPDEELRRVILYWKVWINNPTSNVLSTWLSWGVLSLLQWTSGAPLPIPDDVGDGDFDNRDILDTMWTVPVRSNLFTGLNEVPGGEGIVGHHDVTPRRTAPVTGGAVWWCWGLPLFTGGGVEVGHSAFWSRTLVEYVGA